MDLCSLISVHECNYYIILLSKVFGFNKNVIIVIEIIYVLAGLSLALGIVDGKPVVIQNMQDVKTA